MLTLTDYHSDIQTFFNNLGIQNIPLLSKLLDEQDQTKTIYIFHGNDNGKSAVTNLLEKILNEQIFSTNTTNISSVLFSYKLILIRDLEIKQLEDFLKKLEQIDNKYQRNLPNKGVTKFLINTNALPVILGVDKLIKKKVQLVQFNDLNEKKDRDLVDRILNSQEHLSTIKNLLMG